MIWDYRKPENMRRRLTEMFLTFSTIIYHLSSHWVSVEMSIHHDGTAQWLCSSTSNVQIFTCEVKGQTFNSLCARPCNFLFSFEQSNLNSSLTSCEMRNLLNEISKDLVTFWSPLFAWDSSGILWERAYSCTDLRNVEVRSGPASAQTLMRAIMTGFDRSP